MRKRHWLALGGLVGGMGLILTLSSAAEPPRPPVEETLTKNLARTAKLSEEDANKFMQALAPAIRADLLRGKQVMVPGLGMFRVVRIDEHKDMEIGTGRVLTIPAKNTIEFLPAGEMNSAANSKGAVPAETVPPFQYIPLPGQTPGQKEGRTRVPPVRTK